MENISQKKKSCIQNIEESFRKTELKVPKITLTSRTIDCKIDENKEPFEEVLVFVGEFEKFVMNGFMDLKKCLNEFKKDYTTKEDKYNEQITVLEECSIKKKELINRNGELEEELLLTRDRLDVLVKENQSVIHKLANLELKHNKFLESVALNHREKKIAKKVFEKWRYKLNNQSKYNNMREENKYLKRELRKCHTDAKKAFIRSANKLNHEALSMFQTASNRRLSRKGNKLDDLDSVASSTSVSNVWSDQSVQTDNSSVMDVETRSSVDRSNFYRRCEVDKENDHCDDSMDGKSDQSKSYQKFRDAILIPTDKCRRKKESTIEAQNACQARSQIHHCHCQPLSARSEKCPKCPLKRSLNFANMPVTKLKKISDSTKRRNTAIAKIRDKEKANVMYNPTGTTVVIEKHVSY